jgi:hypothetical protein
MITLLKKREKLSYLTRFLDDTYCEVYYEKGGGTLKETLAHSFLVEVMIDKTSVELCLLSLGKGYRDTSILLLSFGSLLLLDALTFAI